LALFDLEAANATRLALEKQLGRVILWRHDGNARGMGGPCGDTMTLDWRARAQPGTLAELLRSTGVGIPGVSTHGRPSRMSD